MIKDNSIVKKALATIFVTMLFVTFIKGGSYLQFNTVFNYLSQKSDTENEVNINTIESDFAQSLWIKDDLINLNGSMAKLLNMHGYYSSMGMYITDDRYIVSRSPYTSGDYEYEEVVDLYDFLKSNNINLLYVNEPTKYTDDSMFEREFGIETYSNRNMDVFIDRLKNTGVPVIDLRNNIVGEQINVTDLFYRTDHHWTVPAGLWATNIIAEGLNKYCGYDIDTSIYNIDNYSATEWKECWLGEQGRKVAETYVGLDDYTELKPTFPTYFTFKNADGTFYEGTFDDFINEEVYNIDNNVYENDSWHYSYKIINCINNNVAKGKVLLLGDSYDHVTQPFLAIAVHELDALVLRNKDDSFSLRNFIIENGYDTVVISYAQFMLGAHDNTSSANYRMYKFED